VRRAGYFPVPFNATDCGDPLALSVARRLATSEPVATGLKETVRVQVAPDARDVVQVLAENKNELALVPEKL
jgi:hypothetical protein